MRDDLRLVLMNASVGFFAFWNYAEPLLEAALLITTIGYTIYKWRDLINKKHEKN